MNCPICNTDNCKRGNNSGIYDYDCIRCRKFSLTYEAESDYGNQLSLKESAILSYWIRNNQDGIKPLVLDGEVIEEKKTKEKLPNPKEQVERIVYWIGQNQSTLSIPAYAQTLGLLSVWGCIDYNDLQFLVYHMKDTNLIEIAGFSNTNMALKLTMLGWEQFEKLRKSNIDSKIAFIAMQYGDEVLDKIFKDSIKPAVAETGFEIRRLDENPKAGLIDDRLRVEIRRSKFLIADLTHGNKGAYWEAGFAEGLGLPVIYICEKSVFDDKSTQPHFDTNHHLTVKWEKSPADLKQFAEELKAVIRNTFPSDAEMND